MYLSGARGQQQVDNWYNLSGTITAASVSQLLLPQSKSRSFLAIINNSVGTLNIQVGVPAGTATLTSGVVTSITYPDAGFGFLQPPDVLLLGGGNANDPASQGATMPDWPPPSSPAIATATIANGTISAISINFGGSGYLAAPFVFIVPKRTDPNGVGTARATTFLLASNGGSLLVNGTMCPTAAISIWGGTLGQSFTCYWAP